MLGHFSSGSEHLCCPSTNVRWAMKEKSMKQEKSTFVHGGDKLCDIQIKILLSYFVLRIPLSNRCTPEDIAQYEFKTSSVICRHDLSGLILKPNKALGVDAVDS